MSKMSKGNLSEDNLLNIGKKIKDHFKEEYSNNYLDQLFYNKKNEIYQDESKLNYVIKAHKIDDPSVLKEASDWKETTWTKAINYHNRIELKGHIWDQEVPIREYGRVDLIFSQNENEITIIECKAAKKKQENKKSEKNVIKAIKEAYYYALVIKHFNPKLKIRIGCIITPKKGAKNEIEKEILKEYFNLQNSAAKENIEILPPVTISYKGNLPELEKKIIKLPKRLNYHIYEESGKVIKPNLKEYLIK